LAVLASGERNIDQSSNLFILRFVFNSIPAAGAQRLAAMVDVSTGQIISLLDGRQATVRFVGSTHFASGDWIGVELDDATGKNDGSVQGERYFDCEHGFGMFIRPSAVASILAPAPAPKRESKVAPTKGAAIGKGPTSGAASLKRTGSAATAASKRQSATSSPSPAPREIAARNLRVNLQNNTALIEPLAKKL
jgi:dynactin 1